MGPCDPFWSRWFQFWGQQAALEIDSPLDKMVVIRLMQEKTWWFLFEFFLEY